MIIHLDTSVLIDAAAPPWASAGALERAVVERHLLAISAPVLFEWLRGPRTAEDLAYQRQLFDDAATVAFDAAAAKRAAGLYQSLARRRHREIDIAIAACAIEHGATLWTLNPTDFEDIPGISLYAD